MGAHAIVIGIDEYKNTDWNLTGAVRDATAFAEWAVKEGGVDPKDLTLLLSPVGNAQGAKDATLDNIRAVFREYRKGAGAGAGRFLFYYAGHGVAPPGSDTAAGPIVVPSDVDDLDDYVNEEPIGLEIFRGAMQNVAPKEQFYFIDACRDAIPLKDNKILSQQLLWDIRGIDDDKLSTQAIFLGTTAGQKAKEIRGHGLFGNALIAALRGLGPKLSPPAAPPAVNERLLFNDLVEFVIDAVKRGLDELPELEPADRKGIPYARVNRITREIQIAEFAPQKLPKAKVKALVDPPPARASGRIEFLRFIDGDWVTRTKDPAPALPPLPEEAAFEVRGGKHYVRVTADGYAELVRDILVFEDKRFAFELEPEEPEVVTRGLDFDLSDTLGLDDVVAFAPQATVLIVSCRDPQARVAIYDGSGRELTRRYQQARAEDLAPGPYKVTAELAGGYRVEKTVIVRKDETTRAELDVALPLQPRVEQILRDRGIRIKHNYADLEELGEVANIRLGSLLAYGAWAKGVKQKTSSLQVIVGDVADSHVQVEGDAEPLTLTALPGIPAVKGESIRASGPVRVRVEMPGFAPASFATVVLPGYMTALIITREGEGDVDVQQHLIPLISINGKDAPPEDVRLTELAWRALEAREPVDELVSVDEDSNPMFAVLQGYRMYGTGRARDFREAGRLVRDFPGLPDVHVLAGLYEPGNRDAHFQRAMDTGIPVLAEGFWALSEWLGAKAIAEGRPAPALQENVLPGMAWTAFTERPRAARIGGDVRIVGTSGRGYVGDAADTAVLAKVAQSVGLLEVENDVTKASTFLVAPNVALCPIHVATAFAAENANGTWTMTGQARVRFDPAGPFIAVKRVVRALRPAEANPAGGSIPSGILAVCWPVLLELETNAAAAPLAIGKAPVTGQRVATIGFPFDLNLPDNAFAQQFAGASGEKHAMPGSVVRAPVNTWTLDYDCFTAVGTSGGPVVDVETGAVVGMHVVGFQSQEGYKRGAAVALDRFADALR